MELDQALTTTRAVRKRLDLERPVERSVVEECLSLALQAPNGSNRQSWRWVLVDDPALKAQVADVYRASLDSYAATGVTADKPVVADRSDPDVIRMSESVMHLREHLEQVPVLVVPLMAGRVDNASVFFQASMWGSVIPAVWSFMLALRSTGAGQRLDHHPPPSGGADGAVARGARYLYAGWAFPGGVHDRYRVRAGGASSRA